MARPGQAWLGRPGILPGQAQAGPDIPGLAQAFFDLIRWDGRARLGRARLGRARLGRAGLALGQPGRAGLGRASLGERCGRAGLGRAVLGQAAWPYHKLASVTPMKGSPPLEV